jgi:type I restriction enzyme S subunit
MEGQELPVGWVEVPLLALGQLIRGVTYSKKDVADSHFPESIPVLRANNIQDRHFVLANLVHVPSILVSEDQIVKVGDVVIATSSGSISVVGKAAQARTSLGMAFGAFCGLIRPSSEISVEYFGHFFSSEYYRTAVSDMARGVNINNLKKSHFESLSIPLPPLNEQRRIAAKLDTTLAAVEACRQRLDGVAAILKRFRQAVLAAATSGELTREWREERGISEVWDNKELGDLASDIRYGTAQKCSHEKAGNPVLRIPNIIEGKISHENLKYASFEPAEIDKLAIRTGDLLVIRSNGSLDLVGRTAMASEVDEGFLFAGYLIRLRPRREKVVPRYLLLVLSSPGTRRRVELAARSTSGVNNINSKFLSGLPLFLPSLEELQEICRRAQVLFTLADQLEARLTAARKVVDRLTPALLAKAFRGELVPQDPSDEPASELLARIRAARQADAGAGKPSRRGRPKAAANPDQLPLDAAPVPPDFLAGLLRECGALSERALWAVSELEPQRFQQQLYGELESGTAREVQDNGQVLLEAVG